MERHRSTAGVGISREELGPLAAWLDEIERRAAERETNLYEIAA
jgi:hypothetical protein